MADTSSPQFRAFAADLKARRDSASFGLQLKQSAQQFTDDLLAVLFPHFCHVKYGSAAELEHRLTALVRELEAMLQPLVRDTDVSPAAVGAAFREALPGIHARLLLDAEAINAGDPAAESLDEVILAYPGFMAIAIHRLAHELYRLRMPIFPRLLGEYAHQLTGIDIHPGATIGASFAIDHGTGIVIGESTVIGNNVKLYQGVTLGALSVQKSLAKSKRHPTIEENVVIYAQAVILGGDTVVGHDSIVGGNVWLTHTVPPFSVVQHEAEATVRQKNASSDDAIYII